MVRRMCVAEHWNKQFKEGRTNIHDEPQEGRLSDSMEETVRCVRALLDEDRRYTVTNLQREMSLHFSYEASRGTIHTALTEQLEMSKVCTHWVPRQLTDKHRKIGWHPLYSF